MLTARTGQTLIIPATISLALYVFLSFVLLPFLRHHQHRYAHYLPLHTISAHTSSLRDRIGDILMRCVLRSSARLRRRGSSVHIDNYERDGGGDGRGGGGGGEGLRGGRHHHHPDNISIGDEEGEIMVGMHMDGARREALERWDRERGLLGGGMSEGRLSRELEEGFMDDSDSEHG